MEPPDAQRDYGTAVLLDAGFAIDLAAQALEACPDDLPLALEFCIAQGIDGATSQGDWQKKVASSQSEERRYELLRRAGINIAANLAVAKTDSFTSTMRKVWQHFSVDVKRRHLLLAKRRSAQRVTAVSIPSAHTHAEYVRRASAEWPTLVWSVCDTGVRAGAHTNACFWLAVVAGWSRCPSQNYLPDQELQDLAIRAQALRAIPPMSWHDARTVGSDDLGLIADALRQRVCGSAGFMRRPEQKALRIPAFAALQNMANAPAPDYDRWLDQVSIHQYADELVMAATAAFLKITIITVPSRPDWIISEHPFREPETEANPSRIMLGNNDVHYIWLHSSQQEA